MDRKRSEREDIGGRIKPRLTRHAQERLAQRGIDEIQVQLLLMFGQDAYQKGGSFYSHIPKRTIGLIRAALDRCATTALIKDERDKIITAMHQTRRIGHTECAS